MRESFILAKVGLVCRQREQFLMLYECSDNAVCFFKEIPAERVSPDGSAGVPEGMWWPGAVSEGALGPPVPRLLSEEVSVVFSQVSCS